MEITKEIKDRVIECLQDDRMSRGITWTDFASVLSKKHNIKFDRTAFPQLINKRYPNYKVVRDQTWMVLARHYNVLSEKRWNTAKTKAYITVQAHLDMCKEYGIWQVLCDRAGMGKSYAAHEYFKSHKNVFYIDCSEFPQRSDFILHLARQFGLDKKRGSYVQLWREVTDELILLDRPLLILDEFGDCHGDIITMMKGLYNKANQGDYMAIGCYFIGADNLEKQLVDGRISKKQSYAEFWSRINNRIVRLNYKRSADDFAAELEKDTQAIVDANMTDELKDKRDEIIKKSLLTGGVRDVANEFAIAKMMANLQKQGL